MVKVDLVSPFQSRLKAFCLVKEGKVWSVRVVDTPVVPKLAIKPERLLILTFSGALGLLLGICLAFWRNSLHSGFKDPADTESATGLHVFATVLHSAVQKKLHELIITHVPGNHLLATAYPVDSSVESLSTALQFAMLDSRNNVLLFSGPTPGIGKSFICINLAAALAAGGKRVLLIEVDLRKGYSYQYFGLHCGQIFSDLIVGKCALAEMVHRAVAPNLDLLTTGTMQPNADELLLSLATALLLQDLSEQYDLVLIDTPPVFAVSDTQALARRVGACAPRRHSIFGGESQSHLDRRNSGKHQTLRPSRQSSQWCGVQRPRHQPPPRRWIWQ